MDPDLRPILSPPSDRLTVRPSDRPTPPPTKYRNQVPHNQRDSRGTALAIVRQSILTGRITRAAQNCYQHLLNHPKPTRTQYGYHH